MENGLKHIDNLAKDKIGQTEFTPPADAWDKIDKSLNRRAITSRKTLYIKISSAAAFILLFVSSIVFVYQQKTELSSSDIVSISVQPINIQLSNQLIISNNIQIKKINGLRNLNLPFFIFEPEKENLTYAPSITKFDLDVNRFKPNTYLIPRPISVEKEDDWSQYAIAQFDEQKTKTNNWNIGINFSPSYTNTFSKGSNSREFAQGAPEDALINNGNTYSTFQEEILPSISFGVNLAYQINNRWSIHSGINYLSQKNKIENFYMIKSQSGYTSLYSNNTNFGEMRIKNNEYIYENASRNDIIYLDSNIPAELINSNNLIQKFNYIEVPFHVSYLVLNTKIKLSVLSGINTGFLITNEIYLEDYTSETIGKTQDMNKILFKGVIGLSLEYPLTHQLYLRISPSYQHLLNEVNRSTNSNSKFSYFDFNTGISLRF